MFELKDRVALITGGSRGIGRACAITLAKAGAYVVINYQGNELAAAEALGLVKDAGGDGEIRRFNVSNPDDVTENIQAIAKDKGRFDILVNNAGIARDNLLMRVRDDDLNDTWATNLNGAIFTAKAAIRPMMRAKWGRIINISSVVGEMGNAGQAVYSASKAGLIGLTKTLAREYASRGITVNAVAPGFIATDMTKDLSDDAKKGIADKTPIGRVGNPEEIAAAVLYLASEEAGYVTGQTLRVNGGLHM